MRTYEIDCEGLVQRRIVIEAKNSAEATELARREFANLTGARFDEVFVLDVYAEPIKFKEV